ncbi:MAG: c-type cytochrome [Hyphomicrobiaceae bacterium]
MCRKLSRSRLMSWAVGGALAVLSAGPAMTLDPVLSDQLEAEQRRLAEVGRAIVTEHCARCHAVGMNDQSPHAEAPPFRVVVDRYPSEDLAEALAEGLVSGHPDMPVFQFSVPQIEGFIAYLDDLYLQGLAPPEAVGEEK